MNLNYIRLISILLLSALLGILINSLSSRGIPLIYSKSEMKWGSDSLVSLVTEKAVKKDSTASMPAKTDLASQESLKPDAVAVTTPSREEKKSEEQPVTINEPVKIHIQTAYKLYNKNVLFIDARPPEEFSEGHIKGAYSIPFYAENVDDLLNKISKDEPVVVYCSGDECDLSTLLGNKMFKMGFRKIFVFFGGWNEWQEKNYPIENSGD